MLVMKQSTVAIDFRSIFGSQWLPSTFWLQLKGEKMMTEFVFFGKDI